MLLAVAAKLTAKDKALDENNVAALPNQPRLLTSCEGSKTEPNYFKAFKVPTNVVDYATNLLATYDPPDPAIEEWLPIEAIGAESKRERGASSALPPLYFLHVWWARRPLTSSRAAILAGASARAFSNPRRVSQVVHSPVRHSGRSGSWSQAGGLGEGQGRQS